MGCSRVRSFIVQRKLEVYDKFCKCSGVAISESLGTYCYFRDSSFRDPAAIPGAASSAVSTDIRLESRDLVRAIACTPAIALQSCEATAVEPLMLHG